MNRRSVPLLVEYIKIKRACLTNENNARKLQKNKQMLWQGIWGHSIINWPKTCSLKQKGGLGVLNLECFSRALRLRWLWYQWKQIDRAWINLDLSVDSRDRDLFAASTR